MNKDDIYKFYVVELSLCECLMWMCEGLEYFTKGKAEQSVIVGYEQEHTSANSELIYIELFRFSSLYFGFICLSCSVSRISSNLLTCCVVHRDTIVRAGLWGFCIGEGGD